MHEEIVTLAMPYYKKARPGDVEHITWLKEQLYGLRLEIIEKGYDFEVIFALTILHDVGYSKMPKNCNPYDLKIRKAHAKASAVIAKKILRKVGFPRTKVRKALYLIEHHDDWAFGKTLKDPEWRVFTDVDMSWEASRKGFDIVRKFLGQTRKEFFKTVKKDYTEKQKERPFYIEKTKKIFLQDMKYWKKRIN